MRTGLAALAILLAWGAAPSAAQTWSPAQVLSYCSAEEAFGRRVGAPGPEPGSSGRGRVAESSNDCPPGVRRGTRVGPSAGRPRVAVLADSQCPRRGEARAAFNQVRDALNASGRFSTMVQP